MKKLLIYCVTVIGATITMAGPAFAEDEPVMAQIHSMNLSAMPLVSRSLSELNSATSLVANQTAMPGEYSAKRTSRTDADWLFSSLAEPFYLSLLGAGLLILGTVKGRRSH